MIPQWLYFGFRYAHHFYIDFSDETNQGSAFTWTKFPDLVSRLTRAEFYLSVSKRGNFTFFSLRRSLCCATAKVVSYILSEGNRQEERRLQKELY